MTKLAIGLMTWQRIPGLRDTLEDLNKQTYKDFTLYISNGNLEQAETVDAIVEKFRGRLKIIVSHDGNDMKTFRRLYQGKRMAEDGANVIMFIDDDIEYAPRYVATALKSYEPHTYKSGFAWSFTDHGSDYYKNRIRRWDNEDAVHYCGTGVSMVDATIFLEEGLFDAPEGAKGIEDLWLSYYADQILSWHLKYMPVKQYFNIGGADNVALYKTYLDAPYTKADFLKELVDMGWKI
jgi:glycosyltransferase involved in cell wall biosynthesis